MDGIGGGDDTASSGSDAQHPFWLSRMMERVDPEAAGRLLAMWTAVIAHVYAFSPVEGQFNPRSPSWLAAWGMAPDVSFEMAVTFATAGGLERIGDDFFVHGWTSRSWP